MANRNGDVNDPARIRIEALRVMFAHSQIDPDGYIEGITRESRRLLRADLHATVDLLLDEWAISLSLEALAGENLV